MKCKTVFLSIIYTPGKGLYMVQGTIRRDFYCIKVVPKRFFVKSVYFSLYEITNVHIKEGILEET